MIFIQIITIKTSTLNQFEIIIFVINFINSIISIKKQRVINIIFIKKQFIELTYKRLFK